MNRTLTAAVALTAALGTAGLAHAQSSTAPSTSPSTGMTAPSGTQNPATTPAPGSTNTYGAPSTYGAQNPQASTQMGQPNQGAQQVSQPQIQEAQQQLKSAGLYRGAVDGVMGPETQTALSQFQREQGLPQTAQLDQRTLDRLMSGSNSGANRTTGEPNAR
jgi:peptidoglycan hydrolase-like protein with peptidoglycan-binding domain